MIAKRKMSSGPASPASAKLAVEQARAVPQIERERLRLVKYKEEHVAQYNAWMKDPFLLETTCSEPLSLDEEYSLQKEWEADERKWIFILLDRQNDDKMIGDVNLFLHEYHTDEHSLHCNVQEAWLPSVPDRAGIQRGFA